MYNIIINLILCSLLFPQSSYNLYSPEIILPTIGEDETMHFGFWLRADMPDSDGDDDGYLEDYYSISILDMSSVFWHSSEYNSDVGNNFWCSDELDINGYMDGWIQYLDTPTISLGANGSLSARIFYAIEDPTGPFVDGSCTDGWDVANIRISTDGGSTWDLLEDPLIPYDFDCGYGWIWNDDTYESGSSLNHLAKGWGDKSNGWQDFSVDLSSYEGEGIMIRFAFGSDPAHSTKDEASITGFQVDEIKIEDDSGNLFSHSGNNMSQMTASGEAWEDQFYDYGSSGEGRPGTSGWESYLPGLPFNGNTFLDISDLADKKVKFRFQTRYDGNHDGGQGQGLFIDDFMIYKLSIGAYFAPWDLNAEGVNDEVTLTWYDMNASGTDDFIYDNDVFNQFENYILMTEDDAQGWVGTLFDIIGPSTINSISLYNSPANPLDATITIQAYGMFGTLFDTEPTYSMDATLDHHGWNVIPVENWNMSNKFIIGHSINSEFQADVDISVYEGMTEIPISDLHAVLRLGGSAWEYLIGTGFLGEFGIRANIAYEGAGVTYNVYRDDAKIASELDVNTYLDSEVENNVIYEYAVSATYSDGEESALSSTVEVTPLSSSVYEIQHDDGSAEVWFNVEEIATSNNYSAVRFTVNDTSQFARFKWYQNENGGAFYIKVWNDDGGIPGDEIYSTVQASGNSDGWNEKDLSSQELNLFGDFWVGVQEFSSSKSFGLDTDNNSDNSFKRSIGSWNPWEDFVDSDNGSWDPWENFIDENQNGNYDIGEDFEDGNGEYDFLDLNGDGDCDYTGTMQLGTFESEECESFMDGMWIAVEGNLMYRVYLDSGESASRIKIIDDDANNRKEKHPIYTIKWENKKLRRIPLIINGNQMFAQYDQPGILNRSKPADDEVILLFAEDFEGEDVSYWNHDITGWNLTDSTYNSPQYSFNSPDVSIEDLFIETIEMPYQIKINNAYPNPFNPIVNIEYEVNIFSPIKLIIYDLNGRIVNILIDDVKPPGHYISSWSGLNHNNQSVSSGIYIGVLQSDQRILQRCKLILLK